MKVAVSNHISPQKTAANVDAYLLLGKIMNRTGIQRRQLFSLLTDSGYLINDDIFTNWGRMGRKFPSDWKLLWTMIRILSQPHLPQRCTAHEALHFLALTGLPFNALMQVATLFPAEEFYTALAIYLPIDFSMWIKTQIDLK